MQKALILCFVMASVLFALDPYVGDIGCDPWWVVDTSSLGVKWGQLSTFHTTPSAAVY